MNLDSSLPARIGPYRILGLLGEGATGRVYRAEQNEPQREVALKVLKTAGLSSETQQRFRRESELLAQLEHPGIARLYAAGVADSEAGPVPYLAMELVQGVDLMRYARERKLDQRDKLVLLSRVCQAVHYAHSRGIVHRDLKPANILVDATGAPRILDFGVARVAEQPAGMTLAGQVLGTVPYMSAEQLAGGAQRSDPRGDVYSLGVIAYELLAGQLPYPGLSQSTVIEAIAIIRSGRIERLSKLSPATRGDVETVVMKAMAAESAQRYGSAAELAADVERTLSQQPIEARPPTAGYLLALFVRRHRALSVIAAVALVGLILASAISIRYGLVAAAAQRQATARAAETEAVNGFLERMLTASNPDQDQGRELKVRDLLDTARASLASEQNPFVAASLYRTLGETYLGLADTDTALLLLKQAKELAGKAYGSEALQTRTATVLYGETLLQARQFAEAEKEFAVVAALPSSSVEQWRQSLRARRLAVFSLLEQGHFEEGGKRVLALRDEATTRLGAEDALTLDLAGDYVGVAQTLGDLKTARAELLRLIEIRTRLMGVDHPETIGLRDTLAINYAYSDEFPAAIEIIRTVLAANRKMLGDRHPNTIMSLRSLTGMLNDAGRTQESYELAQQFLAASRERYGLNNRQTVAALNAVGRTAADLGHHDEAEQMFRTALDAAATDPQTLGWDALGVRGNYAKLMMDDGRLPQAKAMFETAIADSTARQGADHWETALYRSGYGECLLRMGDKAGARAALEASLAAFTKGLSPTHRHTRMARERLGKVYEALGLKAEAAALVAAAPVKD
ncbi:MAG: protein kinase [Stagnimonas sp.]|nr:protein kinase [Stagnimonas sp.]